MPAKSRGLVAASMTRLRRLPSSAMAEVVSFETMEGFDLVSPPEEGRDRHPDGWCGPHLCRWAMTDAERLSP